MFITKEKPDKRISTSPHIPKRPPKSNDMREYRGAKHQKRVTQGGMKTSTDNHLISSQKKLSKEKKNNPKSSHTLSRNDQNNVIFDLENQYQKEVNEKGQ